MDLAAVLIAALAVACAAACVAVGIRFGRQLARAEFSAERSQDANALGSAVSPLADTLNRVEGYLRTSETDRAEAHGELRAQVHAMHQTQERLGAQTTALVTALRAPQVRGRWGEIQLRRIVESAGMLQHCDFTEQQSSMTDDGLLRPDLVISLTHGRSIIVDSKVPFVGFIEAVEATDEATRRRRLQAHARHVRQHVDDLAGKRYAERFSPSPEFVVMFLPSDAFLQLALEHDPALLEHGFDRDVVIATPSTLLALLRTVAYTWRQDSVAKDAQQVLDLGRELHARLATMSSHLSKLGASLSSSVERFNDTVGSLERKVLVSARRFGELGVTTADLPGPQPVESLARHPRAAEHVADEANFPPRHLSA